MMLTASYVLITLGGERAQVRAGMTYVVINLIASVLFLTAIAFVYAALGTVNLADLSAEDGRPPDRTCVTALSMLLLVVFGIKAAVFPLFFWLPDSLPDGPRAGHRGVRRSAHQGRRLRHHPHPDAAVPRRRRRTRCCSCSPGSR